MKFYYEGKLVRTSKNHIYTHAVIDVTTGSLKGCRANEDTAYSIITSHIKACELGIKNSEAAIKALEAGKSGYFIKEGRCSYFHKFGKENTKERYIKSIKWNEEEIERVQKNWKVVELEAR